MSKVGRIALGLYNHQVRFQHHGRRTANALHDRLANADVGNESAIHNVDVQAIGAAIRRDSHGITESQEVTCENGWSDVNGVGVIGPVGVRHDSSGFIWDYHLRAGSFVAADSSTRKQRVPA